MADRAYTEELLVKLGLPKKLADNTLITSFSDGSMCVRIVFTVEPTEYCCDYRLRHKFGD